MQGGHGQSLPAIPLGMEYLPVAVQQNCLAAFWSFSDGVGAGMSPFHPNNKLISQHQSHPMTGCLCPSSQGMRFLLITGLSSGSRTLPCMLLRHVPLPTWANDSLKWSSGLRPETPTEGGWWAELDLNQRPDDYEPPALPLSYRPQG